MNPNFAIACEGLSKRYRRYSAGRTRRLKDLFLGNWRGLLPEASFWALRDVTFALERGRMLGVVGHNGAGKSTLLRLVGGVGQADNGTLRVNGRVGALLDLGLGFHPELTGRENVFVNGVISGLTRREVARRMEAIVDFAELDSFIDEPLRTYSSGMRVRLGFSIAAHTDPEVLLIDEVLSVGDISFQNKCMKRIAYFKEQGTAILLVTHNIQEVRQLCDEALWMEHGQVRAQGPAAEVVPAYESDMLQPSSDGGRQPESQEQQAPASLEAQGPPTVIEDAPLAEPESASPDQASMSLSRLGTHALFEVKSGGEARGGAVADEHRPTIRRTMRCVLHIGTEKTATTTIQDFLYTNRQALQEAGIALSDILGKNNNRELSAYVQEELDDDYFREREIFDKPTRDRHFEGFLEAFRAEVSAVEGECDTFVISSEHFHSRLKTVEEIARLKALLDELFREVEVLCYFREQSDVARSLYSTAIRTGYSHGFEEFLKYVQADDHYFNYHAFFSKWAEVFGRTRLQAKLFDVVRFRHEDIRDDFLYAVRPEIDTARLSYPAARANAQLSLAQLEFGRALNEHLADTDDADKEFLRTHFLQYIIDAEDLAVGRLINHRAARTYETFHDSNVRFAAEFLGMEGNPFPAPDPASDEALSDLMRSEELLGLVSGFFGRFVGEVIDGKYLDDAHADRLRDIALSYEEGRKLEFAEAIYLMKLARSIRPNGPKIKAKYEEWRNREAGYSLSAAGKG